MQFFLPYYVTLSPAVNPELSREKKLENDFVLTTYKDRLLNKFLHAKFESHNKKVGLGYSLLKLHYFKLHRFSAMVSRVK